MSTSAGTANSEVQIPGVNGRAMRVLHVIPTLGRGGAERQLVNLVRHSDPALVSHVVCYLGPPDDFAPDLLHAGAQIVGLGLRARRPWLRAARGLARVLSETRADIVQTWLFDASAAVFIARLRARGSRWVATLHNPDYDPQTIRDANLPLRKMRALRTLDIAMARLSDVSYVAVSNAVKKSYICHVGIADDRITVIHNSLDPEMLEHKPGESEQLRRSLGIPLDAFVFLNVGRLDPQKGQADLIEAFAGIAAKRSDTHLVIVGRGPLERALAEQASRLGVGSLLSLPGTFDRIGPVLAMADAFVFPSYFEGFGIALLEAMFKGVPCIASRIPAIQELVADGETAILTEPGGVGELTRAMSCMREDAELRSRLAIAATAHTEAEFLTPAIVRQWRSLYQQILGAGGGG